MDKSRRPNIIYRKYRVPSRVPLVSLESRRGLGERADLSLFLPLASSHCLGSSNFSPLSLSLSHSFSLSPSLSFSSNWLFTAHWLSLYRYTDASRFIPGNCLLNSWGMRQQPRAPRVGPSPPSCVLTHRHFSIHLKVCTGPEGKRPTELFSRYRENMPEGAGSYRVIGLLIRLLMRQISR